MCRRRARYPHWLRARNRLASAPRALTPSESGVDSGSGPKRLQRLVSGAVVPCAVGSGSPEQSTQGRVGPWGQLSLDGEAGSHRDGAPGSPATHPAPAPLPSHYVRAMASRKDEKDAARVRREEAQAAAEAQAARRKRIWLTAGGLGAVAAIAVIGVVIASSSGGSDAPGGDEPAPVAALPAHQVTDLPAAGKAAGAKFTKYKYEYGTGNHTTEPVKYPTNPPTNGPHHPQWASDGSYVGTATPATEMLVHALEHGRVEIQYRPGLPAEQLEQLVALYEEDPTHVLLFENATDMPADVAVTAWSRGMLLKEFTPAGIDAIRAFRDTYRDQAPEQVP